MIDLKKLERAINKIVEEEKYDLSDVVEILSENIIGNRKQILSMFLFLMTPYWGSMVNLVVRGSSGTGKSIITRRVLSVFPEDETFYTSGGSEKALIYAEDEIKNSKRIYVEEYDKIKERTTMYEVIKSISDPLGDGYKYDVTDITTGGTKTKYIPPRQTITTTTQMEIPPEMLRRFLTISVDESQEIIDAVVKLKLDLAVNGDTQTTSDRIAGLANYISTLPKGNIKFVPIGIDLLFDVVNKENQDITTKIDYLIEIVKAITLFNHKSRIVTAPDGNGKITIFSTPEDLYLAHLVFLDILNKSTADFDGIDKLILKAISQGKQKVNEILNALKSSGLTTMKKHRIEDKLNRLEDNGLVVKVEDRPARVYVLNKIDRKVGGTDLKFERVFQQSIEFMEANYPDYADTYKISVKETIKDPFTGKEINIKNAVIHSAEDYSVSIVKGLVKEGIVNESAVTGGADPRIEHMVQKILKVDPEPHIMAIVSMIDGRDPTNPDDVDFIRTEIEKMNFCKIINDYVVRK